MAGFISEWWPGSNRNGGRHQIGIPGRIASEFAPDEVSADAGYCSDANLAAMEERALDAYIAPGRAKHAAEGEGGGARIAAMREKIKAGGHETPYRLRKQLPEPVFGQIKQARGFRQFLMRGLDKVAHEWALVCLAHNMLKLAQGRSPSGDKLATA